jgi:hypothetical protein
MSVEHAEKKSTSCPPSWIIQDMHILATSDQYKPKTYFWLLFQSSQRLYLAKSINIELLHKIISYYTLKCNFELKQIWELF